MGRPSKFTTDRCTRFLEALKAGAPYEPACQYAGWDYTTFAKWRQDVEQKEGRSTYFDFFNQVKEAEATAIVVNLALIRSAAKKQWQAAAWLLERRHPEHFARKDNLAVDASLTINNMVRGIVGKAAQRMIESDETAAEQDE